jgi:hypothetical protein
MEFDSEKISFNIFDTVKYPDDHNVSSISIVDDIDELVEEHLERESSRVEASFNESFDEFWNTFEDVDPSSAETIDLSLGNESESILEEVETLDPPPLEESRVEALYTSSCPKSGELLLSSDVLPRSVERPPKLELKLLPNHLKYAFLGPGETLPVIIASNLTFDQES